jgi:putative lipase involved disintegration of autophagic bodies
MDHTFEEGATGFVPTVVLWDQFTDTEGYVGYLPSDNSIYVVFRGSISTKNWLTDFDATLAEYEAFPECDCQVHAGFQMSVKTVYSEALSEVRRLMEKYPTYSVKVTGHSLGAALA